MVSKQAVLVYKMTQHIIYTTVNLTINLQLKDVLFPVCPVQEIEHLYHILVVHCICTFQVCRQETLLKPCFVSARSREVMYYQLKNGSGFKSIILKRYYQREKGLQNLSSTRHCLKLNLNSSGYGQQQQSQKTSKFSHFFS